MCKGVKLKKFGARFKTARAPQVCEVKNTAKSINKRDKLGSRPPDLGGVGLIPQRVISDRVSAAAAFSAALEPPGARLPPVRKWRRRARPAAPSAGSAWPGGSGACQASRLQVLTSFLLLTLVFQRATPHFPLSGFSLHSFCFPQDYLKTSRSAVCQSAACFESFYRVSHRKQNSLTAQKWRAEKQLHKKSPLPHPAFELPFLVPLL